MREIATPPPPASHVPAIDGMRAVAALWVLLHHAAQTTLFDAQGSILFGWLELGRYRVATFIVISGYCLGAPVMRNRLVFKRGISGFYWRRAVRILPAYFACVLLSLLLIVTILGQPAGSIWDNSLPASWKAFFSHVFLVHNLDGSTIHKISYPLWSIPVEIQLYLLFPLLIAGWRRFNGVAVTCLAIVVGYALFKVLKDTEMAGTCAHFIALFALGVAASAVTSLPRERWSQLNARLPWTLLAHLFLAGLFVFHFVAPGLARHWEIMDLAYGILSALVMVSASSSQCWGLTRLLAARWLVAIGTFSYSVYLLHAPLLELVYRFVVKPLALSHHAALALLAALCVPFTLGAAYLFYLAFERPFLAQGSSVSLPRA